MPSEYQRKNEIVGVINDMKVNWADITPSFSNTFIPQDVPSLRTIILAGEEVKKEQVERWAGMVRLINCYGPSECGGCTAHEYAGSDSSPDTIGRPLPCFKFWVVAEDDADRLVSIGAVGELLVEGPTLARGYLKDESRTREAFIESPAWLPATGGASPRRFYRTRDLVQYRTDGSLKFVGRSDTQIKIRGQRVELGETENQLTQYYSGSATSMVAFPRAGKYANRLVALIERCDGVESCNNSAAITFMRGRLPDYMIPSIWLAIDRIPLSTSNKVDRRQVGYLLAGLDADNTCIVPIGNQEESEYLPLPPSDALAHEIGAKVAEMLASRNKYRLTSMIGYDFRLAALGFDSIQAITLRMWLKRRFNANIPVSTLTSDTISITSLADLITHPPKSVPTVQLLQEIETMSSELRAWSTQSANNPVESHGEAKLVFLTGATGYLGREIVKQLVGSSAIKMVFVLIRCSDQAEGYTRIAEAVGETIQRHPGRIEIWPGDLQQTRLGLTASHWKTLSSAVDIIIHNGAVVRWNADYETLKKANVVSTMEILQALVQSSVAKSLVYISGGQQLSPGEDDDAANLQQVTASSGYAQTKLASELLIKHLATSELGSHHRFTIIKPSYIIGSARDGVANTTDYLWRLVAGAIEINAHNDTSPHDFVYLSDVETVARSTISAAMMMKPAQHHAAQKKVPAIKILDGISLVDFWHIVREAGYPLQTMASDQWRAAMRENVQRQGEQHCLWPLMWMLEDNTHGVLGAAASVSEAKNHENTDNGELQRSFSRVKAAVARNLIWLRENKALPGY